MKAAISLKAWTEGDDTRPGFLEIDLVGHDGGEAVSDLLCKQWVP